MCLILQGTRDSWTRPGGQGEGEAGADIESLPHEDSAGGQMKVTVIGTGYLGAVHAAAMASLGFEVVGLDIDIDRIRELAEGRPPFFEPHFE